MSKTLSRVQTLVAEGDVRISAHGYDELADDDIYAADALAGIRSASVIEDYPNSAHGPSVLVLQTDAEGRPIHVVWGIPKGRETPATMITAYRPDPTRWSADFLKRKKP